MTWEINHNKDSSTRLIC